MTSDEFKSIIRVLNLFSHTQHERLQQAKKDFSSIMPVLRGLTPEEQEIFLHKIKNSSGRTLGDSATAEILDEMTTQTIEEKLAKLSEEENFNAKNRYRL